MRLCSCASTGELASTLSKLVGLRRHSWPTFQPLAPATPMAGWLAGWAQGLSREEIEEIQRGLQPTLKAGQRLRLEEQVDPSIIGGVILSIGDKYVDMSILARVKKLQQIVRDAV